MCLHCSFVLWLADFEVVNVHLEAVGGSDLDEDEVMVVLLELLARVLNEEQLGEILKVVG